MLIKISFKYSFFIKIAKLQLNHFNHLVINMNGKKNLGLGGGGCCNCYIILGGGFQKCYTVLYRVGVVKNFQFLRYIICARPLITYRAHVFIGQGRCGYKSGISNQLLRRFLFFFGFH